MPKVDCSKLASVIMDIARWHAKNSPDADIDSIVAAMQETLPGIDRVRVVDSIVEASTGAKRNVSAFAQRLARTKREAKRDKELRTAITSLEEHLKQSTLPRKQGAKKITRTDAIQALMDEKVALNEALRKSDPALREKYQASLDKALKQLEDGNFVVPEVEREFFPENKELRQLKFKRDQARLQVRQKINALRPLTVWDRATDSINGLKTMMATGEFSGVLRQGRFAIYTDPLSGSKAVFDMFRSFASEGQDAAINDRIANDPDAPILVRHGLALSDINGDINQQEDAIMSKWANRIPLAKNFNRAYNVFLNSIRLNGAKGVMQYSTNAEPTAAELDGIANVTNVFTGRGSLGQFEQSAALLNAGLFSPRFQMSRIQMLTGQPLWRAGSPAIRKHILARHYGRTLLGMASTYMMYGLAWGDDEDFDLSFNMLSSQFGKVVKGDIVIDPLAGLVQPLVFLNRAIQGKKTSVSGKTTDIRGDQAKFGQPDLVSQYLRGKLAPGPGTVWNQIKGKDVVGRPTTIGGQMLGLVTPMTYGDIADVMVEDEGIPTKLAISILAMLGEGVQVYTQRSNDNELKNIGLNPKDYDLGY